MNFTARSVYQVVSCVWSGLRCDDVFSPSISGSGGKLLPSSGWLRPHVVGVGQAEVLVEAVPRGQELRVIAQVPLAEDGRGVAALLEHLGDASFRRR